MKKLHYIAFVFLIILACKKEDDITGITTTSPVTTDTTTTDTTTTDTTNIGIEGRWMVSQVVFTETEIGTETDLFDDTTININNTETVTVPGDSLEGFGVEFLTDGSLTFFDNSDNDTCTYSFSNNILTIYGDFFDQDTTIIDVSNLTSNSMNWNWTYTEREIENDSSQGFLSDITYTETTEFSFIK